MTAATVPQAKILRTFELMQAIMKRPMTAVEIAGMLNMHVRNIHRYLKLIDQLGIDVKTGTRPTTVRNHKTLKTYYITQCPCCGRDKI